MATDYYMMMTKGNILSLSYTYILSYTWIRHVFSCSIYQNKTLRMKQTKSGSAIKCYLELSEVRRNFHYLRW